MLPRDLSGDLQPAEILVVGVRGVDMEITGNRVLHPGFDALHHVLIVDVAVEPVRLSGWRLLSRRPRHDGERPAADPLRAGRRVVGRGAFQEAPRGDPDLQLLRPGGVGWGDVLVQGSRLRRRGPRNRRRHRRAGGARRGDGEIDRARVVRDRRDRQRAGNGLALPEVAGRRRSRVGERLQVVRAHRLGRVADDGTGILCRGACRHEGHEQGESSSVSEHTCLPNPTKCAAENDGTWPDYTQMASSLRASVGAARFARGRGRVLTSHPRQGSALCASVGAACRP